MPKGTICLEQLGCPYSTPLNLDFNIWTYFNSASIVLLPSERHERRVSATLNSLFKILIHVVVHMFCCFLVYLLWIKLVIFMLEWVVFSHSVMHFCWPVSFRYFHIFAPLAENTVRMMFILLFSVISWMRGCKTLSLLQVRIKPKLVYTLSCSSFQNVSSNNIPGCSNKTCKLQMHWERSNNIQLTVMSSQNRWWAGTVGICLYFDKSSSTVFEFQFCSNKMSLSNISLAIILLKLSPWEAPMELLELLWTWCKALLQWEIRTGMCKSRDSFENSFLGNRCCSVSKDLNKIVLS